MPAATTASVFETATAVEVIGTVGARATMVDARSAAAVAGAAPHSQPLFTVVAVVAAAPPVSPVAAPSQLGACDQAAS